MNYEAMAEKLREEMEMEMEIRFPGKSLLEIDPPLAPDTHEAIEQMIVRESVKIIETVSRRGRG